MSPWDRVRGPYEEITALESAISLLNWDRQVLMPEGGAPARTAHVRRLTSMRHAKLTDPAFSVEIERAVADTDPQTDEGQMIRRLQKDVEHARRLPAELVDRKARVSSDAYEQWKIARAESNFSRMIPFYEALFDIARETAELIGYREHPYDALIDLYEEGATYQVARSMFDELRGPLRSLLSDIQERGRPIDDTPLIRQWDQAGLRDFAEEAAKQIGFDFHTGRLNIAPNAFCTHLSGSDIRMTTRASEHLKGIVSSSLHEMGHGLYEQRGRREWDGTPLGGGICLGVHESQSRLWENIVGRSLGFWEYFLPMLQKRFESVRDFSAVEFYRMVNRVEPTFIRVGADELTYNMHILVRFELEVEVLTGALKVRDLPEAWNEKYRENLGIVPPNDGLGVLQDVHWSRGSFGYFPTYVMGNLIGAQIWTTLQEEIGDPQEAMSKGDFEPVLGWLTEKIYRPGRSKSPSDLVRSVTGRTMEAADWLRYADAKFRDLYALN